MCSARSLSNDTEDLVLIVPEQVLRIFQVSLSWTEQPSNCKPVLTLGLATECTVRLRSQASELIPGLVPHQQATVIRRNILRLEFASPRHARIHPAACLGPALVLVAWRVTFAKQEHPLQTKGGCSGPRRLLVHCCDFSASLHIRGSFQCAKRLWV